MHLPRHQLFSTGGPSAPRRGSVLVVVLCIVFGLVAMTLYFANTMSYELHASDNRLAETEADYAIEGGRRYLMCVLSNLNAPGVVPDPQSYLRAAVPVGKGQFWLIGRTNYSENMNPTDVTWGLVDEASKLNLNASTNLAGTNLSLLPRMTIDLAYNIMAWRSTNTVNSAGGAESQSYMMLPQPYLCKNAPFETVDELRLIFNLNLDILYGEDLNMNGILDANENDGDALPPSDNMDGRLDPGLLEYVTVYSTEPVNQTNGEARVNLASTTAATQLQTLFETALGQARGDQVLQQAGVMSIGRGGRGGNPGGNPVTYNSPLEFYMASGMTPAEFFLVEPGIRGNNIKGLVNVNTASATVLSTLPGMDINTATQLVAYRQSVAANLDCQNTVSWVAQAVDPTVIAQIGRYLTGRAYQFTADIAAVGHDGRGYRRTKFVFDMQSGAPIIIYRQDLTHLGWALGKTVRNQLVGAKQKK